MPYISDPEEKLIQAAVPLFLETLGCSLPLFSAAHYGIDPPVRESIGRVLEQRVSVLIAPSLTRRFLMYLTEEDLLDDYLDDPASEVIVSAREVFLSRLAGASIADLETLFPPRLTGMIRETVTRYAGVVQEMLDRLDGARDDVCRVLLDGRSFHRLTEVTMDSGDVHNHGHSTALLTTDAGRLVYKPHDVRIDAWCCGLIEGFFADVMQAPKICVCDGYGFAEFIENRPPETEDEARRYFYNLGGLSAVVQMLGSSDLHHNNVLTRGVYPFIIDYELMLTPASQTGESGLWKELSCSLLTSSLMPARRHDREMSILFARDESNRGSPVVGGRRMCVQDDPEDFFEGYRTVYRRCMEQRSALKAYAASLTGVSIRHIYRNTSTYMELLQRIRQPGWLTDPGLRAELERHLSLAMERSGVPGAEEISKEEAEALLQGDIPYFYMSADSRDLYENGRVVFPEFFRVSCVDHLLSRIDYLNEQDLKFETALLSKAMTRVIRLTGEDWTPGAPIGREVTRSVTDAALLAEAERVFLRIHEDAVTTPSGEYCWFGPDYTLETGMHLLNLGLMEGVTGLGVFFSSLHRVSSDQRIRELTGMHVQRILDRLRRWVRSLKGLDVIYPNVEDVSLTAGLTGKLLGCLLMGDYMEDSACTELAAGLVDAARRVELSHEGPDLYQGISGLLKLLCRTDALFALPGVPEYCSSLADIICASGRISYRGQRLWKTLSVGWPISGAGHGQSGIASALYLAGKRLHRTDLLNAAMEGFDFEKRVYHAGLHAWPDRRRSEHSGDYLTGYCSGACGIGIHALELDYPGSEEVLDRALDSVFRQPLQYKDFLCCGNAAIVEFLLSAGLSLNRPELVAAARTRMALVMERARDSHYLCLNEGVTQVFSPGLFYGVSGIGYEMLRLCAPDTIHRILI